MRWHLGVLADAGLVTSRPELRHAPGRPRIVYRLDPDAEPRGEDEYRLLANVLTGLVADEADAVARSERAGRAWGRTLLREHEAADDDEAVAEVVDLLRGQGFAPTLEPDGIHMHRCPFHDLAETHPNVVCGVHRGLLSGALHELGSRLEVTELDVFPRPDVCIARLGRGEEPPGRAA